MYCKECGFQLSDDTKFCPNCGTKVDLNGIGDIVRDAVFKEIEKDDETNTDFVREKAHWEEYEQEQNNNTVSPKDPQNSTSDYIITLTEQNKIIFNEYRILIKSKIETIDGIQNKQDKKGCGGTLLCLALIALIGIGTYMKSAWVWICWIGFFLMIIYFVISLWQHDEYNSEYNKLCKKKDIYKEALSEIYKIPFDRTDYKIKIKRIYDQCVRQVAKTNDK